MKSIILIALFAAVAQSRPNGLLETQDSSHIIVKREPQLGSLLGVFGQSDSKTSSSSHSIGAGLGLLNIGLHTSSSKTEDASSIATAEQVGDEYFAAGQSDSKTSSSSHSIGAGLGLLNLGLTASSSHQENAASLATGHRIVKREPQLGSLLRAFRQS